MCLNSAMHGVNAPIEERVSPVVKDALDRISSHSPGLLNRVSLKFYKWVDSKS